MMYPVDEEIQTIANDIVSRLHNQSLDLLEIYTEDLGVSNEAVHYIKDWIITHGFRADVILIHGHEVLNIDGEPTFEEGYTALKSVFGGKLIEYYGDN